MIFRLESIDTVTILHSRQKNVSCLHKSADVGECWNDKGHSLVKVMVSMIGGLGRLYFMVYVLNASLLALHVERFIIIRTTTLWRRQNEVYGCGWLHYHTWRHLLLTPIWRLQHSFGERTRGAAPARRATADNPPPIQPEYERQEAPLNHQAAALRAPIQSQWMSTAHAR